MSVIFAGSSAVGLKWGSSECDDRWLCDDCNDEKGNMLATGCASQQVDHNDWLTTID